MVFNMFCDIGGYQRCAKFVGLESAYLFVKGAYLDAFFIGQRRPIESHG